MWTWTYLITPASAEFNSTVYIYENQNKKRRPKKKKTMLCLVWAFDKYVIITRISGWFDDKWSIMPLSKDKTINKIIGKLKNLPDQVPAVKF